MCKKDVNLKLNQMVTLEVSVFYLGILILGVSSYLEKIKSDSLVSADVRNLYDHVNEFYKHLSDFYKKVWYEKD